MDEIPYTKGMGAIFKYLTKTLTPYVREGCLPFEERLDHIADKMAKHQNHFGFGTTPTVIAAIRHAATLIREARSTERQISDLMFEKEVAAWSNLSLAELEKEKKTFDKTTARASYASLDEAMKRKEQEVSMEEVLGPGVSMEEVLGLGTHRKV